MAAERMRVLIVDDERDLLEFYRALLSRLPSRPVIDTATTGAQALSKLEEEHYSLMLCDLHMPRMDGFQVLTLVRRRFPELRTAVITGMQDELYRSRAYSIGIDLYIEKPRNKHELKMFSDCIEGLLDQGTQRGFRGIQSKSLVDLVQMEVLTRGSSVLRVSRGKQRGRIWILEGDIIDAEMDGLAGEEAFRRIITWETGAFEILPQEPERERQIFDSAQTLLLNSAQWIDETGPQEQPAEESQRRLDRLRDLENAAFAMEVEQGRDQPLDSYNLDDAAPLAAIAGLILDWGDEVGAELGVGQITSFHAAGAGSALGMQRAGEVALMLGFDRAMRLNDARALSAEALRRWNM